MANIEDVHKRLYELMNELGKLFTIGVINQSTEAKQDDQIVNEGTMIAALNNILTSSQAVDGNTDGLESLIQQLIGTVENKGATTQILVASSASSVSLIPAQTDRVEAIITNDTNKDMWVTFGTASLLAGNGTKLFRSGIMVVDRTDEEVFGIWEAGATGNAIIQHIF